VTKKEQIVLGDTIIDKDLKTPLVGHQIRILTPKRGRTGKKTRLALYLSRAYDEILKDVAFKKLSKTGGNIADQAEKMPVNVYIDQVSLVVEVYVPSEQNRDKCESVFYNHMITKIPKDVSKELKEWFTTEFEHGIKVDLEQHSLIPIPDRQPDFIRITFSLESGERVGRERNIVDGWLR